MFTALLMLLQEVSLVALRCRPGCTMMIFLIEPLLSVGKVTSSSSRHGLPVCHNCLYPCHLILFKVGFLGALKLGLRT